LKLPFAHVVAANYFMMPRQHFSLKNNRYMFASFFSTSTLNYICLHRASVHDSKIWKRVPALRSVSILTLAGKA